MNEDVRALIEILSEEVRETRNLVVEAARSADAAQATANAATRKADAAWEMVVIFQNQFLETMRRPWWKKALGLY